MSDEVSRRRQRLRQAGDEYQGQLQLLLAEPASLIRGSFGTRRRVCGKASCRCAQGQLHESKFLSASDGGMVRVVHVPAGDEVKVAEGVARYRRFQEARRRLAELAKQQLELVDVLGQTLLEPYPPDRPLPPPQRRGRKPAVKGARRRR